MIKMTKSDLYQALFPIYYISKAWGLLPVRFKKSGPRKYLGQLHFIEITYSVCLLFTFICAELWGLCRDLRDGLKNSTRMESKTNIVVACVDIISITTVASVAILGAPFRWSKIQNIMDRLVEVDERLGIISVKKTRRFSLIIVSGSLVYLIVLSILDYCIWDLNMKRLNKMSDKGQINYVPLYLLYVSIVLLEDQIALAAFSLDQRFTRLNTTLENILGTFSPNYMNLGYYSEHGQFRAIITGQQKNEPASRRRRISTIELIRSATKNSPEMIHDLVEVHSLLSDTALLFNSAFGLPALIIVATCLLHLIVALYFMITGIHNDSQITFIAVELMWCFGHSARLLIIVQPCYAASVQAEKTTILVSRLLSVNSDPSVRKQLEIFSLQLLHRPLKFSACGMCTLNRSLITSIAGAVTTYLVILIQFRKEDTSK